jgi:hypothetical protein
MEEQSELPWLQKYRLVQKIKLPLEKKATLFAEEHPPERYLKHPPERLRGTMPILLV